MLRKTLLIALISAILLALLSCSDAPIGGHLIDQPFSQENFYFPGKVLNAASGNSLSDVQVSIDYVLLGQYEYVPIPLPKAAKPCSSISVLVIVDIYNMFDEYVTSVSSVISCQDNIESCVGVPTWDYTDNDSVPVPRGIYYEESDILTLTMDQVLAEGKPNWFTVPGVIGKTDKDGIYEIPPLPVEPVRINHLYFKGWVQLTFTRAGFDTLVDTINVWEDIEPVSLNESN